MSMRSAASLVAWVLCLGACDRGAGSSATSSAGGSPVEGVWRLAEVNVTGANPSRAVDPPSLFIFAETHYSMMRAVGNQPRAPFRASTPTNDEKLSAYDTFVANAGVYEVSGATLTVRPVVSKHPNFMGGGYDTYAVRRSGDTLWLAGRSPNLRLRFGDRLVSDSTSPNETTLKLVRIQPGPR